MNDETYTILWHLRVRKIEQVELYLKFRRYVRIKLTPMEALNFQAAPELLGGIDLIRNLL
jgi:hypothetical protein